MSKLFKRPMFRKGGEVMGGIMSGVKPRQKYNLGTRVDRYKDVLTQAMGGTGIDPATQFLLTLGPSLISGQSAGGTKLQEIVGAAEKPTQQLFANLQKEDAMRRKVGLEAGMLGIKGEQAAEQAKIKAKEKFLKDQSPDRYYQTLVEKRTSERAKLKSFDKPSVDLKFARRISEYDAYIEPQLKKTDNPVGKDLAARLQGIVPFDKKNQALDYSGIMAGAVYFDPEQKKFVELVDGEYFTYDPYTYKKEKLDLGVQS